MKTWVRKTLSVGVLTAGALLLAPTAAQAADIQQTSTDGGDTDGVLNNAQVAVPIDIPINLCSVAVGVLGDGYSAAECSNDVTEAGAIHQGAQGETDGIANNLQVAVPIHVPVNAGGIALGDAKSVAKLSNSGGGWGHGAGEGAGIQQAGGGGDTSGVLNNAQVAVPIDVPINLCGVAVGLLGDAEAAAECSNELGGWGESIHQGSWGETDGVLNNLQVAVPINVPINVCGIAVGVLGDGWAGAACSNGGEVKGEAPDSEYPDDETPVDEPPVDEEPVDEEPVDEEPVDEEPVDEEPVDEEPVDDGSGSPSGDYDGVSPAGDYDGVSPAGDYGDPDAAGGRHSLESLGGLPLGSGLAGLKDGGSDANLAGLNPTSLLSGVTGLLG